MKKILIVGLLFFRSVLQASSPDSISLEPKAHFGLEAQLAVQILDIHHYRQIIMNDSLSEVVLNEYIKSLDGNKSYFLQSDINSFQKYKHKIDNLIRQGDLSPAYEIYDVFKQRFDERMEYIYSTLLDYEYDFLSDEYYDTDRDKLSYAGTADELNELWRKAVKNQFLNLKLNGKKPEDIATTIKSRYDRFKKSMKQYNGEDIFELYMNTIAESYDPHSNYFSPKSSDRFQQNMSLSLEGIGARLQMENDFVRVVEVLPGGPALKSDLIHPDDKIVGVGQGADGEIVNVIGWRLDDVVELIKGPKGTTVQLEILPAESGVNGPSETISLVREKIKLEDMEAKSKVVPMERNGRAFNIGVITLPGFYMDFEAYRKGETQYNSSTRDVKRLVEELKEEGIDGLMIDLRNNGGGSLMEAIDLTGLFIEDGPVVQIRNASNIVEVAENNDHEVVYDGPLTVLINRFSASASEIFAGAIQDYARGVVLGESSFGKGTVQSMINLEQHLNLPEGEKAGQLKLTLQKFYRVTGSSTQHMGVNPDINFPSAFDAEEFGESSEPGALPWDKINGTRFKPAMQISDRLVADLNDDYRERLQHDEQLSKLVTETNELKESIGRTRISLNEEQRKAEREKAEARKKENNKLSETKIEKEGTQPPEKTEKEDKYLREALVVLSDIITAIG